MWDFILGFFSNRNIYCTVSLKTIRINCILMYILISDSFLLTPDIEVMVFSLLEQCGPVGALGSSWPSSLPSIISYLLPSQGLQFRLFMVVIFFYTSQMEMKWNVLRIKLGKPIVLRPNNYLQTKECFVTGDHPGDNLTITETSPGWVRHWISFLVTAVQVALRTQCSASD